MIVSSHLQGKKGHSNNKEILKTFLANQEANVLLSMEITNWKQITEINPFMLREKSTRWL